jgi:hypothetical protein
MENCYEREFTSIKFTVTDAQVVVDTLKIKVNPVLFKPGADDCIPSEYTELLIAISKAVNPKLLNIYHLQRRDWQ